MSWAITATIGVTAYGAMSQASQQAGQAAYSRKQAAYNDKMNAQRAKTQGIAVDTNTLRAKTEYTTALDGVENQAHEAAAQARVAGAALNVGAGSYDTVLNTFAKKTNQAEGGMLQNLVAELVGNKNQRQDIADSATAGMSTGTQRGPSAMGTILGGVANYFSSVNGLKQAFGGSGNSSSSVSSASFQSVDNTFLSTNSTNFGAKAFTE